METKMETMPLPDAPEHGRIRRLSTALTRRLSMLFLIVITVTILSAALVRLAPGLGMDERQFDLRLGNAADNQGLQARIRSPGIFRLVSDLILGLVRGDWGVSLSLRRPIRELFAERALLSLETLTAGLLTAWAASFAGALLLAWLRRPELDVCATLATGAWLCLPAAVVALLFLYLQGAPALALAAILIPRIFRYVRNILKAASRQPYVMAARARGVGATALLLRHICRPAAPELLALAGVSVSMAVSAMIPVEALCDSPGIGQLVWQSASARDLPVLLHLTMLIALVTCLANLISDSARTLLAREVTPT
jgi:peptide/nickel transport system permease protein